MNVSKCLMTGLVCIVLAGLTGLGLPGNAHGQVFDPPTDQDRFGSPGTLSTSTSRSTLADRAPAADRQDKEDIRQVAWFQFAMPKVSMPKVTMPQWSMPKMPPLWPTDQDAASDRSGQTALLAPVAAGARKIKEGTQRAWAGTRQMLTFDRGGKANQASSNRGVRTNSQKKPSMWKRLFTPTEPDYSNDPQTITEWMAQPRPDH